MDKKLTKDNLQKVLFNEENLDNSSEVGSTEVNTTIDMEERREIFWDFHNKFKTTLYKIKNIYRTLVRLLSHNPSLRSIKNITPEKSFWEFIIYIYP